MSYFDVSVTCMGRWWASTAQEYGSHRKVVLRSAGCHYGAAENTLHTCDKRYKYKVIAIRESLKVRGPSMVRSWRASDSWHYAIIRTAHKNRDWVCPPSSRSNNEELFSERYPIFHYVVLTPKSTGGRKAPWVVSSFALPIRILPYCVRYDSETVLLKPAVVV